MSVVVVDQLQKSFGHHTVFRNVAFALGWGERAGLVGPNGVGKTTLLDVLAGRQSPDGGRVAVARSARIGYLTQDPELPAGSTVREAALGAFDRLEALEARLTALGEAMAGGDASPETLAAYGDLQAQFEHAGGYDREHTAEATLAGLGLPERVWLVPVERCSGGQRVRLALCRLLLAEPDLLLCDEPTNHLDADAVQWLEARLLRWGGALLCVAHDRYFLDRVATRVIELTAEGAVAYSGNYSAYVRQRAERAAAAGRAQSESAAEEQRLLDYIERYRAGNRARQAKSRSNRLDRLRAAAPPAAPAQARGPTLRFAPRGATGREVLSVEGLAKAYGATSLFAPWEAQVSRGERVGIVGPNGAGKTTLLRILAGEESPDTGLAYWGRGVEVSWFRQDMGGLDDEATVLENVLEAAPDQGAAEARHLLARFLFRGDAVFRRAGDLSGGERNRLLLCLLAQERANVLLCDEPTNHLDIPGREALEEALAAFPGTLLLVSHDRFMLARLCTRIWWVEGGRVRDVSAGYAAYEALRGQPGAPAPRPQRATQPAQPARSGSGERRRLARLAEVESLIAAAEAQVHGLEETLADPDLYRDGRAAAEVVTAYEGAKAGIAALYAEWEGLVDAAGAGAQVPQQESRGPDRR